MRLPQGQTCNPKIFCLAHILILTEPNHISYLQMLHRRPKRVVNSRSAVRTIIYPVQAVEVRTEETPKNEILEPLPVRKRLPGDRLLKQMAKQRQKQKEKRQAQAIDEDAVNTALTNIMHDLGLGDDTNF